MNKQSTAKLIAMGAVLGALFATAARAEVTSLKYDFGPADVKFNALFQGWISGMDKTTTKDQGIRLRRLELKVSGQVLKAPKYFLMVDPAKLIVPPGGKSIDTINMLQDFGLEYALVPGLELRAGQFKAPTTAEGLDSSAELPLPERSVVGRAYGDRREIGARILYKQEMFNVASMVSTGQNVAYGQHQELDTLHTRFEVTPMSGMGVGTFVTMGKGFDYGKQGRWGLNGRYRVGSADLRLEYAQGNDSGVAGRGYTSEVGYYVSDSFEPVFRFETFHPNQSAKANPMAQTLGANYFLRDIGVKMQVAGTFLQNMSAINGSPSTAIGTYNRIVTFVLQSAI